MGMCRSVENRISAGVEKASAAVAKALRSIDEEISLLEKDIRGKERLEWRSRTKADVVDEMSSAITKVNYDEVMELGGAGAVEFVRDDGTSHKEVVQHEVWGQVYVGAEAENARRDELLLQRRRLLGQD